MTDQVKLKSMIQVVEEYFADKHNDNEMLMANNLKAIFESDPPTFLVIIFSIVTFAGIKRPDFAMDMMMSWLRDKVHIVKIPFPEAADSGGFKES